MQVKRLLPWSFALLLVALFLVGCAPRPGAGETVAAAAADAAVVDLPSVALDVAPDGSLSVAGIPVSELSAALGTNLPAAVPAGLVKTLQDYGIQHVQIANNPDGLALIVNGMSLPSFGWTAESLGKVGQLIPQVQGLDKLLPILTQLGVGVTLRLPVAGGAEAIPLAVSAGSEAAAEDLAKAQEAFVTGVQTAPKVEFNLVYEPDGTWTSMGLKSADWANLTGQKLFTDLNYEPNEMALLKMAGITDAFIALNPDGLSIQINDTKLPSIDWSGGKLATLVEFAKSAGVLEMLPIPPEMLDAVLPMLSSADVQLHAQFPEQ